MRTAASPRLLLASASPARLRTLHAAGIDADVMVSGVDESAVDADRPDALCAVLARMKALAVAERLRRANGTPATPTSPDGATDRGKGTASGSEASGQGGTLVLGCDSVLSFEGEILGKPADEAEAVRRWRQMRGRSGTLFTGHCLVEMGDGETLGQTAEGVAGSTVRFADVTDAEIDAYVATGEPLYVAGAFTIDGIGGPFIEGIDGDPGTVIGLSLPLLRRLLAQVDLSVYDLWRPALRRVVG